MRRREFITGIAGAASLSGAPAVTGAIDTHTHFYDPARPLGVPWPPKNDTRLYRRVLPDEFRRLAAPLGVSGTIVVEASAWLEDNQWILDLAREHPVIRGFVGRIEPGRDFGSSLSRFAKNPLFRGIRLGGGALGASGPALMDDLKRLVDAGLSLDVVGNEGIVPAVVRIAERLPDLRIVFDHLPYERDVALADLAAHPHIYAKVSGVLRRDGMEDVWKAFGPDRVIYGSNWPVSERQGSYSERFGIVSDFFTGKGSVAADKYFRVNSKAAYNWPGPRP